MTNDTTATEIVRPGDEGYERLSRTFAKEGAPARVVRPRDAAGVAEAVGHAVRDGLVLSVRSGGHSVPGYGTNDGGVVIDLAYLNGVEVLDDDLVRIGAGARWGEVSRVLAPHGLVISSGDTDSVGVGGLMVGGGIGWLVRKYGLALDHLVEAEVVTAAGKVLRVAADENADLFWAIRGGGGEFGVITSFLVRARRETTVTFARVGYPADDAAAVLKAWRDVVREAGEELTSSAHLYPAFGEEAPASIMILAAYAGDDPAVVEPLTRLGEPTFQEISTVPYAEVLESAELPPGWRPMVRNRFAPVLTDELIDAWVSADIPMMFREIRAIGGAMGRGDDTAFAHRDSEAMLMGVLLGTPADHPARLPAYDALWEAMEPHVSGAYANFFSDPRPADVAAVYPPATRARLAAVKRAYDPARVFSQNLARF
ncbi:FAD-binding oxidoreductase [Nonomuraea sp. NPDC059007]|uniref:FAD-binding oxidoreductase n=1 Tax=Nonomuraea sp. NPDC059007 TaxID=3346692 RepID=UPI0036CF8540